MYALSHIRSVALIEYIALIVLPLENSVRSAVMHACSVHVIIKTGTLVIILQTLELLLKLVLLAPYSHNTCHVHNKGCKCL